MDLSIRPFKPKRKWKWKRQTTRANRVVERWLQHQEYKLTSNLEIFGPGQVEENAVLEAVVNRRTNPDDPSHYPNKHYLDEFRYAKELTEAYRRAKLRRAAAVKALDPEEARRKWLSMYEGQPYQEYSTEDLHWRWGRDKVQKKLANGEHKYEDYSLGFTVPTYMQRENKLLE